MVPEILHFLPGKWKQITSKRHVQVFINIFFNQLSNAGLYSKLYFLNAILKHLLNRLKARVIVCSFSQSAYFTSCNRKHVSGFF